MKLISTTKRIIALYACNISDQLFKEISFLHAFFMQQTLELWMFVPCKLVDGIWVVLEEPKSIYYENHIDWLDAKIKYQEAKDRVLFEGFNYSINDTVLNNNGLLRIGFTKEPIVEDLLKYDLTLTPTAKKLLGYE